jgi:hypothetical protein
MYGFDTLGRLENKKSRCITAENPTGEKGMGARATEGPGAASARELGIGWKISPCHVIQPGETYTLADIEGPGVIESIWIAALVSRNYILRFYWEGETTPAVECPGAEFFAYSWQQESRREYQARYEYFPLNSAVVAVNPRNGMNCYWPMPFKKHCRITLENRSDHEFPCFYQINYSLQEVPEDIGYFHAQYRQKKGMGHKEEYVILDRVNGKGKYVGTALFVGLNGEGNWWGEGEVKMYLDGDEEFPTICGTGTEDYFGGTYDWDIGGQYRTYTGLYAGMHQLVQSDGLYHHQQRFSLYRWHITDSICFDENIKVTIQDLGWKIPGELYLSRRDDFASVAYWYQDKPALECSTLPDASEFNLYECQ